MDANGENSRVKAIATVDNSDDGTCREPAKTTRTTEELSTKRKNSSSRNLSNTSMVKQHKRPATTLASCRKSDIFLTMRMGDFGKDSPKIIIGSSRSEPTHLPVLPGPGHYNVETQGYKKRSFFTFPKAQSEKMYQTLTSNIEFKDTRNFPEIRPLGIGKKTNKNFFDLTDSPGPSFIPPTALSKHSHIITNRTPLLKASSDFTPGPGSYDPNLAYQSSAPSYSLSGPSNRDDWIGLSCLQPGPASYAPKAEMILPKGPKWCIGDKSRQNKAPKKPIVIDTFILRLNPGMKREDAVGYIDEHPMLKTIIHEIFSEIIDQKPNNPLEFIKNKFHEEKQAQVQFDKPKTEDIGIMKNLLEFLRS